MSWYSCSQVRHFLVKKKDLPVTMVLGKVEVPSGGSPASRPPLLRPTPSEAPSLQHSGENVQSLPGSWSFAGHVSVLMLGYMSGIFQQSLYSQHLEFPWWGYFSFIVRGSWMEVKCSSALGNFLA